MGPAGPQGAGGRRAATPALQLAAKYSHLRGLTLLYDADQRRGPGGENAAIVREKGTVPFESS